MYIVGSSVTSTERSASSKFQLFYPTKTPPQPQKGSSRSPSWILASVSQIQAHPAGKTPVSWCVQLPHPAPASGALKPATAASRMEPGGGGDHHRLELLLAEWPSGPDRHGDGVLSRHLIDIELGTIFNQFSTHNGKTAWGPREIPKSLEPTLHRTRGPNRWVPFRDSRLRALQLFEEGGYPSRVD